MNDERRRPQTRDDGFTSSSSAPSSFGVATFRAAAAEGAHLADVAALVTPGHLREAPTNGNATLRADGAVTGTCTAARLRRRRTRAQVVFAVVIARNSTAPRQERGG